MGWLSALLKRILSSCRGLVRPSDTGLFDPYLPITSLKPLSDERQQLIDGESQLVDQNISAEEGTIATNGLLVVKLLLTVIMTALVMRLVVLQISKNREYTLLAKGNSTKDELVLAPRGIIYDRNGVPLVKNIPSFMVGFRIVDLPKKKDQLALFGKIADILGTDGKTIQDKITANTDKDIAPLLEGLTRNQSLTYELKFNGVQGVEVVTSVVRQYADVPSLGFLLGYVGKINSDEIKKRPDLLPSSSIGKSGIEKTYDSYLQGTPGIDTIEVDSAGRAIRTIGNIPATAGKSIILSIDVNLQILAAQALKDSISKNNANSGAATVLDPSTGEVLAMVSVPDYNNNVFSDSSKQGERQQLLTDPGSPMLNRAIAGQYPSGSTIKPVIASAALAEKVISANTKIDTSAGKITIGQWVFPDWKIHGVSDVKQAIAESNNIFFYTIGGGNGGVAGLGAERLARYLQKFGFGSVSGIDIGGEESGLVPTPEWKKKTKKESWYIGDTYNLSIGQGDLLVTPVQMANSVAAIANGGTLFQPRLARQIVGNDGQEQSSIVSKTISSNLIARDVLDVVRQGMRQTVTSGSGRALNVLPIQVAAKTGTAQFDVAKQKTHSWFTAFAPYANPKIALSVIIEGGGEGYTVAEPVARNIIEKYFNLSLTPITAAPVTSN